MSYIVNWTEETKSEAIRMLTNYLSEHGTGESIHQMDDAILEAPCLLARIADLKGLVKYDEEEEDAL